MSIEPDLKDWTWVVEKRCPECGFDASAGRPRTDPGVDACQVFADRLALMVEQDDPLFANWDQDVAADQLLSSAEAIAAAFGTITGEQWQRTGRRSNGSACPAGP